jgi:hypothetical protein
MDRRVFFRAAGGTVALASGVLVAEDGAAATGTQSVTAVQRAAISFDCSQTITRFFGRLDALNRRLALGGPTPSASDDPWDLVTSDGEWRRNGSVIASKADFAAAIRGLPKGLLTSHQVVNLLIESVEARDVSARFSLTIYDAIYKGGSDPALLGSPDAILGFEAHLSLTAAGWRIRQMTSDRLFFHPPR